MSLSAFYKDKVVLVTGSSMGIGKELARQVLILGGKVVITARHAERLNAVLEEFKDFTANILVHAGDVTDYDNNILLIEKTIDRFGRLNILINNAALSCFGDVEMMKPEVARKVIDTNIYGCLFPVMAALPELKKSHGSILFVSSVAGFHGLPGYSAYSLSKMSLKALVQSLRGELKSSHVFAGIAYVGFTKNEEDKKMLSPDGQLVNTPARPKKLTASRETTALKLLHQIKKRKHVETHSLLGIMTSVMSRYFPALLHVILSRNYRKPANEKKV
jgi:NADP-dependent 3-hydroxy acid dehydrogenase YdfG